MEQMIVADQRVTRRQIWNWVADQDGNALYYSLSLEDCIRYCINEEMKEIKAIVGNTRITITVGYPRNLEAD